MQKKKSNNFIKIFTIALIVIFLITSFGTGFLVLFDGGSGNVDIQENQDIIQEDTNQSQETNIDTSLTGLNITGDNSLTGSK